MSQIFIKTSDGKYMTAEYSSGGDYIITGIAANPRDAQGETTQQPTRLIAKSDYAGSDTNITIEEVYNQIKLTCNLEELEEIVTSPTNEDDLYSPFTNRQKYATEFIAWGEGESAFNGFWELLADGTDYDGAEIYHHYIQVQKSNAWRFNGDQYISQNGTNQQDVLMQARQHTCTAFLCSMGHTEGKKSMRDNTVESKISMDNFLVISINGNGKDDSNALPTEQQINAAVPVAEYIGNMGGGYISPTDDDTTNYIVISGKIMMQSEKQKCTQNRMTPDVRTDYPRLKQYAEGTRDWMHDLIYFWHQTVHLDDGKNGDGGYYFTKFYKCATPQSTPQEVTTVDSEGIFPYNDQWKNCTDLIYNYSSIGSNEDKMWKYPMLAVELKIGEKYCVETVDSEGKSSYAWKTLEQCPTNTYNGESQKQTWLFIGPNPAIDDFLIGKMWDIANSVTPEMGIDAEGIAIPVKKSDQLSGKVSMKILGPVNSTWNEIERIHPTWFRHTQWNEYTRSVLGRTATIFIKDFEVNVYSDNAAINNIQGDKDLVYMTNLTGVESVNALDDIEFDICTALTTEECTQKGIRNSVKMNNPYIDKEPLRSVYNKYTQNTAKPEEHYVSDYYDEYCTPQMLINSTVRTSAQNIWTYHWTMNSLPGKVFLTQGYSFDVKRDAYNLTLKEE